MTTFLKFLKKYSFPLHLYQVIDILMTMISIAISTSRLKGALSLRGCKYGKNLCADGRVVIKIEKKGTVTLGENVMLYSRFKSTLVGITNPIIFQCIGDGHIIIGNNTGCTSTVLSSRTSIQIGDNVKIGANVRILDHDYHALNFMNRRSMDLDFIHTASKKITIGNDVLIGTDAIILKGVNIGDRTIVGAGAVVSLKKIPPDSLVIGNPAMIINRLSASHDHPFSTSS